jgi:hypothetical protein
MPLMLIRLSIDLVFVVLVGLSYIVAIIGRNVVDMSVN